VAAVVAAAAILFTLELASNSDEGGDDGDENLDHTHISSRCFFEEGRKAERQNSKVGLWLGWGGIVGGIIRKAESGDGLWFYFFPLRSVVRGR